MSAKSTITPLNNNVVLEVVEEKKTMTEGGIHLPENASETGSKPAMGLVIAVGPGKKAIASGVKKGQTVIYAKYSGTEVELQNKKFVVLVATDIVAEVA